MASPASHKLYRFGSFEVNPYAGEVRKQGIRIRVQDQPLLLLAVLLERPRTLITREELHSRLWPDDTFVDFENGLNTAVARLRQALGDSARTPRFIESVPRRGYRFIAAVETISVESGEPIARAPVPEQQESLATGEHDLQKAAGDPITPASDSQRGHQRRLLLIAGSVLIGVAVVAWLLPFRNRPSGVRPFKFSLMAPEGTTFIQYDPLVLSPDGRLMAFPASDASGDTELWVRPLDELAARRLEGTKGASFPFWSPDGRSIAFFANGKLKRVEIAGGLPRIVCDSTDGRGGSWNRDGIIVFSPSLKSPLLQVAAGGGNRSR
jgi:DNA-binding winged helix-turn-helix (wHTH) protein